MSMVVGARASYNRRGKKTMTRGIGHRWHRQSGIPTNKGIRIMEKRLEHFLRSATEHGWKIIQRLNRNLRSAAKCHNGALGRNFRSFTPSRHDQVIASLIRLPFERRSGPWKSFPTNFFTRLNLIEGSNGHGGLNGQGQYREIVHFCLSSRPTGAFGYRNAVYYEELKQAKRKRGGREVHYCHQRIG